MSRLLYVTANVKEINESYSLSVGKEFIDEYKKTNPNDEIITIDLFKTEVPFLDEQIVGHVFGSVKIESLDNDHKKKISLLMSNLEQFMSADKYVFAVPLWNFSVPPVVRAYFDNVSVSGKTFKFTDTGHEGLIKGRKALCIQAAGGFYYNAESQLPEHGYSYIKTIMSFMGIDDVQGVFIEGVNKNPDKAEEYKKEAINKVRVIAKSF